MYLQICKNFSLRSLREGNVYSHVCLSVHGEGWDSHVIGTIQICSHKEWGPTPTLPGPASKRLVGLWLKGLFVTFVESLRLYHQKKDICKHIQQWTQQYVGNK